MLVCEREGQAQSSFMKDACSAVFTTEVLVVHA